ncbi:hypothetical protein HanIR_Chr01g0029401 [Helianthus annuus]|nr:hypothetical protein HanIR_Chr01g0029401 [Helianthus annuus]
MMSDPLIWTCPYKRTIVSIYRGSLGADLVTVCVCETAKPCPFVSESCIFVRLSIKEMLSSEIKLYEDRINEFRL